MIQYGRQAIDAHDAAAVLEVLRSDHLTCGPRVQEFEERFAERVGARYAVAMNSATAALHVALRVAGVASGDRVVTSPNTFLASANCAAMVGAVPDFADIDAKTYNLDPDALKAACGRDVKAVVAVDFAGQACDLPRIAEVARRRKAIVIDDASHAVGGGFLHDGKTWRNGGNPWADFTVFSFHPVKTMTTGEGGMLVTDRNDWAVAARKFRSHGVVRDGFTGLGAAGDAQLEERGPWYYEMADLGYNYRITDLQCALGLSQLAKLDAFIARRRAIVARYNAAFAGLDWLRTPQLGDIRNGALTSWHLYVVQLDFLALGISRTRAMAKLREHGVASQVHYIPVYLQPWYRQQFGYRPGKCPVAENYYRRALSLPLYPAMTDEEVARVIDAVKAFCAAK